MAALTLVGAAPVFAQNVPRIKAVLVSFDGSTLTVKPDGEKDTMKIGVRPATRIMREEQKSLADIHTGDFIGATLNKSAAGAYTAQEVHLFPEALRGSGEGLYPATPGSSTYILDGAVTQVGAITLALHFRGLSGEGASCTGRAPLNPLDGCQGSASIGVPAATTVIALLPADKGALKPGVELALSVMAGPDGRPVTPGLTIESIATPPVAMPPAPAMPAAAPPPRGKKAATTPSPSPSSSE